MSFTETCQRIVRDPLLSPAQKSHALALAAENALPYPALPAEVTEAMAQGVLCDMFEGHAPYKPRYVLPDYEKFLRQGSPWLELAPPQDFDEALDALRILYHHVPSVTGMPVWLGRLDHLLLPFVGELDDETLYRKLKGFWIYLDRVLPDAFMHVNIGPDDNRICRLILRIDGELKQVAPNLSLFHDPASTPDSLLMQGVQNIALCGKPHIVNYPIHRETFDERGFGIVSCYNALPLGGGANTLVRLSLKGMAEQSADLEEFMTRWLPHYCEQAFRLIEARAAFLHHESGFFASFLVEEGLIEEARFVPMFGIFGMAEAVNLLMDKAGLSGRYGHDEGANQLGHRISARLSAWVTARPQPHAWGGRALLHSQGGLSLDQGVTPGVRIPYGEEPDPASHLLALAPHHGYYHSGISEILTLDPTIRQNPQALLQLCKGAFALGMREFSANVADSDLVRVTGYMIRKSDVARFAAEGSRLQTTCLGAEASELTGIRRRAPRVVGLEASLRDY
ncbi:YjjI family glycine radical enzyme [Aeromonas sp. sif0611]|uniref:YjjI family glycine radical enzyme n=1 Tax=Aeromonas sp. sif0611 TaxID=2854787 RepID=UPI001C44C44E|nr:YjjI family glycine radical enzyme [Aeromonas sp. sif0611]MBV7471384.1 YjjI family glycine radical enzyme [Aeromonas sp. sif0611]